MTKKKKRCFRPIEPTKERSTKSKCGQATHDYPQTQPFLTTTPPEIMHRRRDVFKFYSMRVLLMLRVHHQHLNVHHSSKNRIHGMTNADIKQAGNPLLLCNAYWFYSLWTLVPVIVSLAVDYFRSESFNVHPLLIRHSFWIGCNIPTSLGLRLCYDWCEYDNRNEMKVEIEMKKIYDWLVL